MRKRKTDVEEEIIIIIDPPPIDPNGRRAGNEGYSVRFVSNGPISREALRAAKRAIRARLNSMGDADADEE
jgi:hypothetical protein